MTQPNTVNMTFDTSLIDLSQPHPSLNASFSTTESEPSDAGYPQPTTQTIKTPILSQDSDCLGQSESQDTPKQSQVQAFTATAPKPSTPVQHMPTQEAYDAWASVYDADGNMLQAIDDLELSTLLPELVSRALESSSPSAINSALNIIDLGCGTGRNTAKLVSYPWPNQVSSVHITGLDFSRGMLDVAAQKLEALCPSSSRAGLSLIYTLAQCDCFPTVANPSASPIPVPVPATNQNRENTLSPADALLSTLVLEHVPLSAYFTTLSALVKPGGIALVTNMHDEMGRMSQAGFVNKDGVKVKAGKSFIHSLQEVVDEAGKCGFEVLVNREREVRMSDVEKGDVGNRGLKWVGVRVWYGVLLRRIA